MNHLTIQQKSFAAYEEKGSAAAASRSVEMICPKPRRLGLLNSTLTEPSQVRSLRWHSSLHHEVDAKAGNELLDFILTKGTPMASSPPFFSGSPPSRVSNPLIKDSRFGNEKPAHSPSSSSSSHKPNGCVRLDFGNNPAVRIEGFDCLDRDRRGCTIPTLA